MSNDACKVFLCHCVVLSLKLGTDLLGFGFVLVALDAKGLKVAVGIRSELCQRNDVVDFQIVLRVRFVAHVAGEVISCEDSHSSLGPAFSFVQQSLVGYWVGLTVGVHYLHCRKNWRGHFLLPF